MVEGTRANLTSWDPQKDLILRVCVSNAIGYGPWSQPLVVSSHDHAGRHAGGEQVGMGPTDRRLVIPALPVRPSSPSPQVRVKHLGPGLVFLSCFSSLCFGHTAGRCHSSGRNSGISPWGSLPLGLGSLLTRLSGMAIPGKF